MISRENIHAGVMKAAEITRWRNQELEVFDINIERAVGCSGISDSRACEAVCKTIHWELFCNGRDSFKYIQPKKDDERPVISAGFITAGEVENITDVIMGKYLTRSESNIPSYLEARDSLN